MSATADRSSIPGAASPSSETAAPRPGAAAAPPLAVNDLTGVRTVTGQSFYGRAWAKLRHDPTTLIAVTVLGVIIAASLLAPLITDHILHTEPNKMVRAPDGRFAILRPPGFPFWLGTDDLGRDALTRLLHAGRVSLLIGFLVMALSLTLGTTFGLVSGYFGGRVDDAVNAIIQVLFNVPTLFLLIILSVTFRPGVVGLAVIIGLISWGGTARHVRGVVLSARSLDYVAAAQVLGASGARIITRHILPNVANIVLVVAGFDVAAAILGESALSFLGLGVQVPQASWGNMLSGSQELFRRGPWLVYPPGVMIFLTVLSVVLIADGLRDALDPRVK